MTNKSRKKQKERVSLRLDPELYERLNNKRGYDENLTSVIERYLSMQLNYSDVIEVVEKKTKILDEELTYLNDSLNVEDKNMKEIEEIFLSHNVEFTTENLLKFVKSQEDFFYRAFD